MEKIIIDKELNLSEIDEDIAILIRAKSLTALRSVDLKRKEALIGFSSEIIQELPEDQQKVSFDLVLKKWTVGLSGKRWLWRAVVMLLKLNRGEEVERRM